MSKYCMLRLALVATLGVALLPTTSNAQSMPRSSPSLRVPPNQPQIPHIERDPRQMPELTRPDAAPTLPAPSPPVIPSENIDKRRQPGGLPSSKPNAVPQE
jgi:hypothetical protein